MSLSPTSPAARWAAPRPFLHPGKLLAARAIMGAALPDNDPLDKCAAARAWLAILLVDAHMIVILASLAPQVAVFAERCSAMLYPQRQRRDDAVMRQASRIRG